MTLINIIIFYFRTNTDLPVSAHEKSDVGKYLNDHIIIIVSWIDIYRNFTQNVNHSDITCYQNFVFI